MIITPPAFDLPALLPWLYRPSQFSLSRGRGFQTFSFSFRRAAEPPKSGLAGEVL